MLDVDNMDSLDSDVNEVNYIGDLQVTLVYFSIQNIIVVLMVEIEWIVKVVLKVY